MINQIFAYKGNLIWTFLFIGLAVARTYLESRISADLPRDARMIGRNPVKGCIKQYVSKIILKNVLLLLIFFIIDRTFILTGGSCSSGSKIRSAERCKANGGKWEGGFDISGHFCFLVNISMILWLELQQLRHYIVEQELQFALNTWCQAIVGCTVSVLIMWIVILMVTSIYYHTVLEKIIGCAMGYICPIVMFVIIPKNLRLNKLLYQ